MLTCCHPPPRRSRSNVSSGDVRPVAAFPQSRRGRPSHRVFRGRLGVHACYGLPTCRRPDAAFCLPGSNRFVTSAAAGIATRPGRPLPGQDLHLLEQRTFHGAPGPLHREALALFNSVGDDSAAQGHLDFVLDVFDADAIARGLGLSQDQTNLGFSRRYLEVDVLERCVQKRPNPCCQKKQ